MVTEEELKTMSPEEIRKLQEENCVFCKIGKKEIPSNIIYEDDTVIAFLDIQPLAMGHTIITTKNHNVFFSQLNDHETGHLFKVAKSISQCMLKALQVKGVNIFIANGEYAGQMAPHFIMHIIPRKEGEKIPIFHPVKEEYDDATLLKIQNALVSRIEEVMKIDMKSVIEKRKEGFMKKQNDDKEVNNQKAPAEKHEETNKNQENESDEPQEDIDLDKISELFK